MNVERIEMIEGSTASMDGVLALRYRVFVVELGVPMHEEIDHFDWISPHLVAWEESDIVGTLRMVTRDGAMKIGRVAVSKERRGRGVGRRLIEKALSYAVEIKVETVYLNSQVFVVGFYKKLGFSEEGNVFLDAGIEHIRMRRDACYGNQKQMIVGSVNSALV